MTKQELKAAKLRELEEEQRRLAEQEAKKKASAAAKKEADLPGYNPKKAEVPAKPKDSSPVAKVTTAGTKQGLNDSMAKRLGAEKGTEMIENRKRAKEEARKKEAARKAAEKKENDLPGYKPKQTMSEKELARLLGLDREAAEKEISAKKEEYSKAGGGTLGAVRSGMKIGNPNKKLERDYEGLKAMEEEIANAERDIVLSDRLKKDQEYFELSNDRAKMALGLAGYEKYMADKEAREKAEQEERGKQSLFEQAVFAGFNSPDNTLPSAGFQQAVNAHREDSSEIEPNDQWTEEQKRVFGYYIYIGDIKKANEFALQVNNAIRSGEKQEALEDITEFGMRNKFAADVATIPGSMLRGADFLDDLAQYAAQGYISENSMPLPGEIIDDYRGTRGEMLNIEHGTLGENAGVLEGKGFGDLYQLGMSTADSLFAAYTGGKPGALVSAFGSSATSAVDEALARGATAEQAIGYGALAGAAELLPEYMSVDSLLKILPSKGTQLLTTIGKQGLTEGAEGLITSVSSALADEAVLGELSKYNTEVNNLMLSGMSREEAEKAARNSVNEDIILDTIGEAIGGFGSGGFAATMQNLTAGKKNVPVPFGGTAPQGTEAAMVADKIAEIENRPISEAEKAAKIGEVMKAVEESGTEPGLFEEAQKFAEYHQGRAAEFEEAVSIGKKLGITVEFDENLAANGVHTADGRIIINPNTENPALQVFVHELTHDIETSGLYEQFSKRIFGFIENAGIDIETMRTKVREDYSEAGIELSSAQTDAEIVAKFAEQYLFTNEKAIERLCNTEPTLFERIRYWISDMVAKFKGEPEERFLREAERLYEKALASRGEITGAGVEQYHYSSNLSQDINDILNGKQFRTQIKIRDFTPQTLVDMGVPDYPMYMNGKHIRENILSEEEAISKGFPVNDKTHYHGLGKEKFIEAINSMDAPIEVYRWKRNQANTYGENDYIVITQILDQSGNKVIVPIHINCHGMTNDVNVNWNEVKSVYGRNGLEKYLENWTSTRNLEKIKRKSQTNDGRVQFPATDSSTFSNNNVPQNQGGVNGQKSVGRSFDELAAESQSSTGQVNAEASSTTPAMERADKRISAEEWVGIAERIEPESKMWVFKDFARFLDSAAGDNKILRQKLFELYEKPLNEAQGAYARNYAEKVKSITEKFKELDIKAGSEESAAVQRIGEGVREIDKHGNTEEYTLDDLKKEFPDSWQNIKAGADYCRAVYDEFLHDLNAMYAEIYPATVEQANERVSGYDKRIENYAEYIDRYGEVIESLENRRAEKQAELAKKRPDSLVYAEIKNQIANIDHKIEVAHGRIKRIQNRKLAKEISRDTLKAQIENGEILRNKQIRPRKDYFRHFQELTDEFAEIADIFSNDQRIPPNLAGKSADTKPRTIWTSIAQSRKNGNYYTEDAVGGLLRYTEIAEKLLVFDPLISHFRDVNTAIRAAGVMADNEVKGKGTNAGQFARHMDGITNQMAGKTNPIFDRVIADWGGGTGRAVMKAVEALNRRVKSNAILGNLRSAIVQIGNIPNASLYIQNPKAWGRGAILAMESIGNKTAGINEARKRSNFMNRRYMGDSIDNLTKDIQQNKLTGKLKDAAIWLLGAGDRAAAELIWHTAYAEALHNPNVLFNGVNKLRDYDTAIDYADDITRRSIGGRAEGDIPLAEESKIIGLMAPFEIEVTNTFNAFAEQIKKKNAAGIIAFEVNVFLLNCVLEAITGDRPLGLDYIDAAWDILKEAFDPEDEEEQDFWDFITYATGRIFGETISSMPLGTQIGSFLTAGDEQKAEDWFGDSDPTRYGTGNIGAKALADAADYFIDGSTPEKLFELATDGKKNSYDEWSAPVLDTAETFLPLVMPWGGKQLSRTLQGVDQLIRGGAFGTENDGREYMKFPQRYDAESILKTLLFGQYASDDGQNYIDSGFKDKLSANQTEQMKLAEKYGISKEEFYDVILGLKPYGKKAEKQEALFDNPELEPSQKDILDYILFGKPTVKAAENGYVEPERNYSSEENFYRSGLSDADKRLFDAGYAEKEIEAIDKGYDRGRNKGEKIDNIQNALGCSKAEAFEIYSRRTGKWIDELSGEEEIRAEGARKLYGMSAENYLAVLNLSGFGVQKGEEFSTKAEDVIPNIAETLGIDRKLAEEYYNRVVSFDYSREDIEEEEIGRLDIMGERYDVDDRGYFIAKNAAKIAEGKKDEYGNTVSGSVKAEAVENIANQLHISKEEAMIYYLAAEGDLVLTKEDLSSSHREDLETAKKHGWTERQFLDAVNVLKLSGASKKNDIIKALMDAGASYEMAQGYYNLREDKDYNRYVGETTVSYGLSTQKQADKVDFFVVNYGTEDVSASEVAKWIKAAKGKRKKNDIIGAYQSAGASYSDAVKLYSLMQGRDKEFNTWYEENGG